MTTSAIEPDCRLFIANITTAIIKAADKTAIINACIFVIVSDNSYLLPHHENGINKYNKEWLIISIRRTFFEKSAISSEWVLAIKQKSLANFWFTRLFATIKPKSLKSVREKISVICAKKNTSFPDD
ncbi:MAG: hypothetical protein J6U04_00355 [Salinivirgaceae bacterium]|nr:hypothetical protein [Salinivirgaceae bacterium]